MSEVRAGDMNSAALNIRSSTAPMQGRPGATRPIGDASRFYIEKSTPKAADEVHTVVIIALSTRDRRRAKLLPAKLIDGRALHSGAIS